MTGAQQERLQAAADLLADLRRNGLSAAEIMAELVAGGAKLDRKAWTNTFRFGGLAASCTWSADRGLLENWQRTATLRLAAARQGGAGSER